MNCNKKKVFAILATVFLFSSSQAKITMPALFGDGMVLQQQTNASIWGKTDVKGKKVTLKSATYRV